MLAAHALVAEVAAELIHPVKATYDEPLEIKFIGDTQIERYVECIVMCGERPRSCTTGDALQYRSVYLYSAIGIEKVADSFDHLSPLEESFLHTVIDHEVDITLTEALLWIGECIKHFAVFFFYHRQRA